MPGRATPNVLDRADALRQKAEALYLKTLEKADFANLSRQRAVQLSSELSATKKKEAQRQWRNSSGIQFLKVDLDVALNFAKIALHSHTDTGKRRRNQANARKAHDAVVQWKKRLVIGRTDVVEINAKLRELRAALEKLGETI